MDTQLADGLSLTTTVGFSPMDIFNSAMSLAANFWQFVVIGLAFTIGPWIFDIIRAAVARQFATDEDWEDEDWVARNARDRG
jgi:hypothetical protein